MRDMTRFSLVRRPSEELEMMLRAPTLDPNDEDWDEDEDYWRSDGRRLTSDWDVEYALARQLGLKPSGDAVLFERIVEHLVPALEAVCHAQGRARKAAAKDACATPASALEGSTLAELLDLYEELKWRGTMIESVKLANLAKYLRRIAAENIGRRVEAMLERWETMDLDALTRRHDQQPARPADGPPVRQSVDLRQRRRDHPRSDYTPPAVPDAGRR
jgi:hypothetical protein